MQLYQHLRLSSIGRLATWANALALGACLLLAALACGLRSPLHDLPLERDEGAYAIIATRWLAGDALYRDLFDHKPPLVYLVFALARILPGDAVRAIRVLATLYLLLVSFAVLALGWRLYGRWPGVAAQALVLAYGTSRAFEGLTFNSESVLVLPATLGCLLVVVGMQGRRPALFGWAGMCVGLAVASKPVGAVLLAPQVLAPLMVPWPWRRRLAGASLGLAGAALPLLGFGLLLWRQGALAAAFEALISYNRLYAADSVAQGWYFEQLWRIWAPMFALGLPALAGLVATTAFREWRTAAQAVTALWGLVLLATALLSLRAYPHYYLAAVPFLSMWAGAGVGALGRLLGWARVRWLAWPVGLAALAGLAAPPVVEIWPLRAQSPRQQIAALFSVEGEQFFAAAADVADYVAPRVPADRAIFVWAAEPEIYVLANRRPATRFVYDYPIDRLPGARDHLLVRLRQAPPLLLITYHAVRPIGFYPFADDYGYRLRTTIGGYDVFERPDE